LVEGEVVGTWTHALKNGTLQVTVSPFRRLARTVSARVKQRTKEIGEALSTDRVEVKFL
jgi:hypothetical protein